MRHTPSTVQQKINRVTNNEANYQRSSIQNHSSSSENVKANDGIICLDDIVMLHFGYSVHWTEKIGHQSKKGQHGETINQEIKTGP